jgi:hypothetical protein
MENLILKTNDEDSQQSKLEKKDTDITSMPLSLEFPGTPQKYRIDSSFPIQEYSIVSPAVNNIQNIQFNNYINYKGKNLFNNNNNFESPFRTNNNMSVHFHSSPIGFKIGSFQKTLQDMDNFIQEEQPMFAQFIKQHRNILNHLDYENSKTIRQNLTEVKLVKNGRLMDRLLEKVKLNTESGSKMIMSSVMVKNEDKENVGKPVKSFEEARPKCNCKKSKCLKLYCECFANGLLCVDCSCNNCHNVEKYNDERTEIIEQIKTRNPEVFNNTLSCNCTKSNCEKKYCGCYNQGQSCSKDCRCLDCKNQVRNKTDIHRSIIVNQKMSLKDIKRLNLGTHGVDNLKLSKRKREDGSFKSSILKTETPKKYEPKSAKKRRSTTAVSMPTTAATSVRKRNVEKLVITDCKKIARRLDMHEFAK